MIIATMYNRLLSLLFLTLLLISSPFAGFSLPAEQEPDTTKTFTIAPDDPIVAALDSLVTLSIFRNIESRIDTTLERKHNFPASFVPVYDDSIYVARLARLNENSPFDLVFNAQVKSFINLYAMRQRGLTERVLGLGQLYFPYFEEQLDRFDLPLELKYLAVIESALNPTARSRAGASGMWQFMYHTGRIYGLEVGSYVDDRNDVTRSTIAACEHFRDLYEIYEDWALVIAAYNSGPGNVNRAIRRAGGVKDFWIIRNYLPRETRNYVPAFIAVTYVLEHAEDHNLYALPPVYSHHDVDTIVVRQQLGLRSVSKLLDIPLDHLRYLNPSFRQSIIPHNPENPYVLTLPKEYAGAFVMNEEAIYNYRTPEELRQEALAAQAKETTIHVVRSGEVLGSIARKYSTSVGEIQRLNNLRGTMIKPGQRLVVRGGAHVAVAVPSSGNVHVVRRGETLGAIARRYRISLTNLKRWNNISGTTIHPGQRLVVKPTS
ncbi:MAG: LysM peptidoglycan-binding domain-containing protein [Bacteroidales bacterium]